MADKFDRSMDDFRLNATDDDDEVNTRGDNSPRMITAAGSFLVYNPHIISRHTAQIAFLKTEIEGKDEEIERLKKETRELRKENEELKVALHSKNKKIKALENKIDKLESDKAALQKKLSSLEVELESVSQQGVELKEANKANEEKNATLVDKLESDKAALQKKLSSLEVELESVSQQGVELKEANKANEEKNATLVDKLESDKAALQKKLSSLEVELESVRQQGVELKEANKANQEKNATLEEELEKMSKKVDEMNKTLDENALKNASRKKEIKNVQETVQLTALSGGFDKKPLTQSSEQQARIEKATINLSQLCWQILAMMYQSVFPHCYDDKTSYKVKHIEEDIDGISDDQRKDDVKQRWDELKKKLNWKKARHQRAMKSLQDSRNQTAHPTLTEKVLVDSADLMNKEGRLSGWHSYECVKELIEMWKTLKQQ